MRTEFARLSFIIVLGALAACDGGGDGARVARPDELRLQIVRGESLAGQVRTTSAQLLVAPFGEVAAQEAGDPGLLPEPVVVRISVISSGSARASATGPSMSVELPQVAVNWRTLEPWCQPHAGVTIIGSSADTARNFYRVPTTAGTCHMIAEGVVNGQPFGSDTAVATFAPGPVASWTVAPHAWFFTGGTLDLAGLVTNAKDANGNAIPAPAITAASGDDGWLERSGLSLTAIGEADGMVTLTSGAASAQVKVFAVNDLNAHDWRLTWACFDRSPPGAPHVDSATYELLADSVYYVGAGDDGVRLSFIGEQDYAFYYTGAEPRLTGGRGGVPARQMVGRFRMGWGAPGERSTDAVHEPGGQYIGGDFCAPGPPAFASFRPLLIERL